MNNINKKGSSLSGWTEIAIGVIIFLGILAIVIVRMNSLYSETYNPTFNIVTNETLNSLKGYQGTLESGVAGETAVNIDTGISLSTLGNIIISAVTIMWGVVTGSWIENIIGLLHFGQAGTLLALGLRILFVFSIGFIIIRLILKVKP